MVSNVAGRVALDPNQTFEIMGYCTPEWIAPQRYKTEIETLGGGAVTSPSVATKRPEVVASSTPVPFWLVRGVILPSGVQFDPLFQLTIQGNTGAGTGTYSLIIENSVGQSLFTRQLTPETPVAEAPGTNNTGLPGFSETLPVTSGAAAIVLDGPDGSELGRITLGGIAPKVAITTPTAGFVGSGTETVGWTIQGSAAPNLTSMVLYSPDDGTTWSSVGEVQNSTSLAVNFDQLPGSTQALIQVLVSDGVNTGSATSPTFTVTKKKPTAVQIDNPTPNFAQPSADPVILSGSAYDPDDGVLSGSALQWSSSVQGSLGSGSPLSVHLQPGNHTINLVATDSDGNSVSVSTNVTIGGEPPVVNLSTQALNTAPTTCEAATIGATPGQNGAPLSSVQYSLDGGTTYTNVSLNTLPYTFVVPGSGFFHLVARAYDTSGQSNALDTSFFTQSTCESGIPIAAVAPPSLTFISQPVGTTSASQPVTLSNTGNATLTLASITASANFGTTNACAGSVVAGGSCTINVTFSPTATGALAGTLTITDNSNGVTGSTQTVNLTGTGTGPVVSLSGPSLSFGNQPVSTTSAAQTETVTNIGTANLAISTVTLGGTNAGDFAKSADTCTGATVTPNGTCTMSVTFKPTAGGTRTGSIAVSDNAPGSPHSVALSGTGQDFTLTAASGSSMSANVSAGQSATYTLSCGRSRWIQPDRELHLYRSSLQVNLHGFAQHADCGQFRDEYYTHGDDDRTFGQRATLSTASSGQAAITRARRLSHARLGLGWSGLDRAGLASARGEPTACHVPNARGRVVTDPGDGRMWRGRRRRGRRRHPRNARGDILPDGDGQHGLGLCNPEPQPHPHPDRKVVKAGGSRLEPRASPSVR